MTSKQQNAKKLASTPLFVLEFGPRRVLVPPPTDYDQLQRSIRRHFPELPLGSRASYHTKELEICEDSLMEVSPDIWGTVVPMIKKLTVRAEPGSGALSAGGVTRRVKREESGDDTECMSSDEE